MNTFQFSYDCIIDCGTTVKNLVCPSIEINYYTRVLNISLHNNNHRLHGLYNSLSSCSSGEVSDEHKFDRL